MNGILCSVQDCFIAERLVFVPRDFGYKMPSLDGAQRSRNSSACLQSPGMKVGVPEEGSYLLSPPVMAMHERKNGKRSSSDLSDTWRQCAR